MHRPKQACKASLTTAQWSMAKVLMYTSTVETALRHHFRGNDTATTEIYTTSDTLSLHDALPISGLLKGLLPGC